VGLGVWSVLLAGVALLLGLLGLLFGLHGVKELVGQGRQWLVLGSYGVLAVGGKRGRGVV
jgi:hypothetical protein